MGCCQTTCVLGAEQEELDLMPPIKVLADSLIVDADGEPLRQCNESITTKVSHVTVHLPDELTADVSQSPTSDSEPLVVTPSQRRNTRSRDLPTLIKVRKIDRNASPPSAKPCPPTEEFSLARWYVDVREWILPEGPESSQFLFLINCLDPTEQVRVRRFVSFEDQKRALVSRLLARQVCSAVLGIPDADVRIKRTKGNKPFLATPHNSASEPNFNFNISHDGDYVVVASEAYCVCGIDVVDRAVSVKKYESLTRSFTVSENELICSQPTDSEKAKMFSLLWSCKEAYTKARGDGLKFELSRAEFSIVDKCGTDGAVHLSVVVDGVCMPRWAFHSILLDKDHRVTVARGPPCDVVDANGEFASTLKRPVGSFTTEQWACHLHTPHPTFTRLPIGYLVPEAYRHQFAAIGGHMPAADFHPVTPASPTSPRSYRLPQLGTNFFGAAGAYSPRSRCVTDACLVETLSFQLAT
ncbi:4prime-phosphopantetheinyl transferase HetI [Diplonema papillatum]|nr:4prime-phosphopantetheinyl transferase HetI [Diplonema papillatum]